MFMATKTKERKNFVSLDMKLIVYNRSTALASARAHSTHLSVESDCAGLTFGADASRPGRMLFTACLDFTRQVL